MSTPAPLPPELRAVVDTVVGRARLSKAERALVRDELESHFRDALEAGCDPAAASSSFGDVTLAGDLIGRARRRNRPPAVRFAQRVALPALGAAALLLVPYGYSAWRLGAAPARTEAPSFETGLEWVPDRVSAVRAELDRVDTGSASDPIRRALGEVQALRATAALLPEIEAAHLYADIVETFARVADGLEPAERLRLLSALDGDFAPRRDVVRRALGQVLDRVYPPHGDDHPTRDGLRAVRRLKGGQATWRSDLLEPAYFLFAASRAEAEHLARQAMDSAWYANGTPDPVRLRRVLREHRSADRTFAVTLIMSRVASALESAHGAARTLETIRP